ncbi:MAG: T9SS type A sorting domain-containing protein [Bacteroidetes bacterium]|nr:T9SS type A sorting domain-containing protein [Bacteroidota bacterium]
MKRFSVFFSCILFSLYISGYVAGQSSSTASHSPKSGLITFQVDMTQWVEKGLFNPAADSLDMPGTMNNWTGSPLLQKVDTSLVYQIVMALNTATAEEFRFRINRDSNNVELVSHMYRVPNDTATVKYMYNDYDTATVPITFKCHMYYQIRAGHFDPNPLRDYLDVAGSFNGNGAYDLLFDRELDSIYQVTLNLPKSLISPVIPLMFKFRINGDTNNAEFPDGGPSRTYFLQDTTGGVKNLVDVWYNNIDPSVPAAPFVTNVSIQGIFAAKQVLTGAYSYEDYDLKPEGNSLFRWYIADSVTQVNLTPIGDSTINYVVDSLNAGKYIAFDVTPVAAGTGDSLIGKTVRVWTGKIGAVGISNLGMTTVHYFPNPASEMITFDNLGNTSRIEFYSFSGQRISILETLNRKQVSKDISGFSEGIYLLRFCRSDNRYSTAKFIKR